jgi:hypothetical protein
MAKATQSAPVSDQSNDPAGRHRASAPLRRPSLDGMLDPQPVAVIGATERPGSVGAAVMRNRRAPSETPA